jgi:hypothetical protein
MMKLLFFLSFINFINQSYSAVPLKELKKMAGDFKAQFNEISYQQTKRNLVIRFVDDSIFAYADYNANQNIITVSPMIAREINHTDEFAQVLCHELGHFVAGNPMDERLKRKKNGSFEKSYFSAEGQAEYFSSFCLKKIWQKDSLAINQKKFNESGSFFEEPLEMEKIKNICDENNFLCQRILAVHYLTKYKMSLFKGKRVVSFTEKDERVMPFTIQGLGIYPTPQCLLDNGIASTLCPDTLESFWKTGSCLDLRYVRPTCWFKPQE